MSRIIILDDMSERHDGFKRILEGHTLKHTWTYYQFIEEAEYAVMNGQPFDMACLDHDLGDNLEITPDRTAPRHQENIYKIKQHTFNGRDVAMFLQKNWRLCPKKVLIHSWNPEGAEEMENILRTIHGVQVKVRQFGR